MPWMQQLNKCSLPWWNFHPRSTQSWVEQGMGGWQAYKKWEEMIQISSFKHFQGLKKLKALRILWLQTWFQNVYFCIYLEGKEKIQGVQVYRTWMNMKKADHLTVRSTGPLLSPKNNKLPDWSCVSRVSHNGLNF